MKKKIIPAIPAAVLAVGATVFAVGCGPARLEEYAYRLLDFADMFADTGVFEGEGALRAYYLDVGQGDSEFIELPDGRTMLIDASEASQAENIEEFIRSRGVSRIDYAVITHPHSDHYGGMKTIINDFDIGEIYMPDAVNSAKGFTALLEAIGDKGVPVTQAKAGVSIAGGEGLSIDFIAPNSGEYDDLNDYSAVVKLSYGNTSFLFMGDAETLSEREITADVKCDVIKVGHHGSKSSSGAEFVKRTSPDYAVISVGRDNQYGLPKDEIIKRWENAGAEVLRTDMDGTVAFASDGSRVERIEP